MYDHTWYTAAKAVDAGMLSEVRKTRGTLVCRQKSGKLEVYIIRSKSTTVELWAIYDGL